MISHVGYQVNRAWPFPSFGSRMSEQTRGDRLDPPPALEMDFEGKCHVQLPCKPKCLQADGAREDWERRGQNSSLKTMSELIQEFNDFIWLGNHVALMPHLFTVLKYLIS